MIEWIVTSSILIVVVIALRFLFKGKISRRLQYALWGLVLLRLLLPFSLFESPFSIMHVVPDSQITERQVYVLPISKQPVAEMPSNVVNNTNTLIDTNSFGYTVLSEDGITITRYAEKMSIGQIVKVIWMIGSIVVGLWFLGTNVLFYRHLRKTRRPYPLINCTLPVYITGYIASPCLFGIFHPAIYLTPKAVENEDNTRYALAHELCHYRHADHIWSFLRCLCLAVWWWNPLVWAAAVISREDSEFACDEAVIHQIGQENRLAYGYTLVHMIAVRKASTGLMCTATTMTAGSRSLKGRLNLITKNPKTFIPAIAAVLLILSVSAGCTFTGATKNLPSQGQEFPVVNMVFSSDNTDLEHIGRDAAEFYYTQLMKSNVPQYWHITKYETLSCELKAGDQAEFAVWVTSYLETDGAGFLVGQGIPHNPNDPSKGGICPEVGREFRIKALDNGKYEIVSVGTGGGDQGLTPAAVGTVSYALTQLRNGEVLSTLSPLSGNEVKLAEDTIMNYMIKSAAWPGIDVKTLDECYLLRATYADSTTADYYAYVLDGNAVMQRGERGLYSLITNELYEQLAKLAQNKTAAADGQNNLGKLTTTVDRTNLDACISDAILNANTNGYKKGDFAAQAHTVLKTVENRNSTTVFAMVLDMEFGYAGSGFSETGGSHMPVAITFEKNSIGEYDLIEYWRPKDGSDYARSIKEKFPFDIEKDALDTQKYIVRHIQACYEQAIQYGKVNTDAEIAKLIETITSTPAQLSSPQAYIEAHQAEYRKLIYYGDHTLRYSFTLFEQGGQNGLEGQIMASACQDILGLSKSSLLTKTGQEWYDAYKKSY